MEVFIQGETIDLVVPTEEFAYNSDWYSWLNRPDITRYLEQGVFPNTRESQRDFYRSAVNQRLLLIVQTKKGNAKGVVSLSYIDHKKKCCDFALLIDNFIEIRTSGTSTLEATALIVQHGFDKLGMHRIQAGQHTFLSSWQQRMELIGFRLEGIHRRKFVKGSETADSVSLAITDDDYNYIRNRRGGKLFDSAENMNSRIKNLPEMGFKQSMEEFLAKGGDSYYSAIFNL